VAVDCAGDSVLAVVKTGAGPAALLANPVSNRVYTANQYGDDVSVIDGAANAVLASVTTGMWDNLLVYDPNGSKVYCSGSNWVVAISGATNEVIRAIPVPGWQAALACNPVSNKVYAAGDYPARLSIIDAAADSVIASLSLDDQSPLAMACNPVSGKAYCATENAIRIYSGSGDTLIKTLPGGTVSGMLCNPTNNEVYCLMVDGNNVMVVSGAGDSVVKMIAVGTNPQALAYDTAANRLYVANNYDASLSVIDCGLDSAVATVAVNGYPVALGFNPTDHKVYAACDNSISVIDAAHDSVVASFAVGGYPNAFVYSAANDWMYFTRRNDNMVVTIDGVSNQIVDSVIVDAGPTCLVLNPQQHRVYSANMWSSDVSVISDSALGVAELRRVAVRNPRPAATIVRGVLVLGAVGSRQNTVDRAGLLDITGRKVLELKTGANDVSRLAPGVYFIREQPTVSGKPSAVFVRKVVIA
jgi:YVTN family beta-propeller protein